LDAPGRYASWIACFNRKERLALYTEGFSEQVRDAVTEEVVRAPFLSSDASTLIERLLDVDTQTFLPGQLLVKMDIASMAHSLEVRSPFLDHCLMEIAATLPLSAKVVGREGKHLLKEAVRPWVPSELLDRPKRGFSMPVRAWFRDELRNLPATILLDARARGRDLFEARNVERLIGDHQRGRADHAEKLWALVQLELWFRTFVDVVPTGPIALDLGEITARSGRRRSVAAAMD
jgi:asparagine synthase (glutamine-hydrolysing)